MYSSTHEMYYLQHAEIDLVKRGKVHQTGSLPISDDDSGCAVLDEYAWVPPGLTPKQVTQPNIWNLTVTGPDL